MMKELYDITLKCMFLRCLRDFEKWSWFGKNGEKWGKMGKKGCPRPRIITLLPLIATFQLSSASFLNLERSQNGKLGNGLNHIIQTVTYVFFVKMTICTIDSRVMKTMKINPKTEFKLAVDDLHRLLTFCLISFCNLQDILFNFSYF